MRFLLPSTIVCLSVPNAVLAQDASDNSTIVVTGAGLPLPPGTAAYGSVLIGRDRLNDSASGRVESLLGDVAGFQQFRRSDSRSANPSAQGVTLRALGGNASSRALVLLDGVPLADPFFGYIPFTALVPEGLSSVRVTRGGGTGAFGAGALAGTIETTSATRDQLSDFTASVFRGSRDATELSVDLTQDLGAGYVALVGRWEGGDGFMTTPDDQRVAATARAAYAGWSTNMRVVAPVSTISEVQFRTTLFRDDRTLRFVGADSHSEGQDASIRYVSRGRWQVDAIAYVQARNFSNIIKSATSFRTSLDQRNTPSTGLGGKIELRPPIGAAHILRVGGDTRLASGDMFEDVYDANSARNPRTFFRHAGGEQTVAGLFVEDDWTLGRLILSVGGRTDRWSITNGFYREVSATSGLATANIFADRTGWATSGRAGALYRLSDGISLRAATYSGFRLPTLNELYRPFVLFPITTLANAALRPEKLRGWEAGVDIRPWSGASLSVTAFDNRLSDAIANVTIAPNRRQRANVDGIIARGVEVTAAAAAGDMRLSASYAYSDSHARAPGQAFDRLRPAQSPRHAASATLAYGPAHGLSLSATMRYVSAQYEDDLESDVLPAALTVDAIGRLPIGHGLTLVARGENLFDERVVTRNAGGSVDLGTPRTLWIGLRFAH